MLRAAAALLLAAVLSLAGAARAQACAPGSLRAPLQDPVPSTVVVPDASGEVTVVADRIEEIGAERRIVATGNVEITRGTARLLADRVELDRDTGEAVALGRVIFYDGDDRLTGDRIDYNIRTGTGVVHRGDARTAPYYRLRGDRMERLGENLYRVYGGAFTTCEDEPPSWSFRFGRATADTESYIFGTSASFWVKSIPLIPFIPVFAAPIRRERQSGFLFPKVGSSNRLGAYAEVPFYWAISDSQDATIAPIVYGARGYGGRGEYRFVLAPEHRGDLSLFLLGETMEEGDVRAVGTWRHEWVLRPGLRFTADVNTVSDDDVLRDYGDPLEQRSAQRVESNVALTRNWTSYSLVGDLFWYQDLTTRRRVELQRLPDLRLFGMPQPLGGVPGLLYQLESRYVHFVRDVGSDGNRLDIAGRLSRPFSPDGLFTVRPFVGGRLTGYDKRVIGTTAVSGVAVPVEVTEDDFQLRRIVEAGTDVEATLSRVYRLDGTWGLDAVLHTVEPRVNYTWASVEDDEGLPLWQPDIDRVPDASLVTYSLTNRVRGRTVAPAGTEAADTEMLRLTVGHSYDLRRTRPAEVLATLILAPSETLSLRTDLVHGVHGEGVVFAATDVTVRVPRVTGSVGLRYSDTQDVNFVQASLAADLTAFLGARLTTNYDVKTGTFVDNRVAVDVKFQCWAFTVEYVSREPGADEVRFAVNLLGVGGPLSTGVGVGATSARGR